MIHYINSDKMKSISSLDYNSMFVIFDFDRTITSFDSETSWSILEKGKIMDENYKIDSKKLYDYYRKIEIDESIDPVKKSKLMEKWVLEQLNLLMHHHLDNKKFNELLQYTDLIKFRNGTTTFFNKLYELNIPVMVISAGLGNVVLKTLKDNNCLLDNVIVISNEIYFDEKIIKIKGDFVNCINKNDIVVPDNFKDKILNKNCMLLFGDQISDLSVMKLFDTLNKLSIGFLTSDTKDNIEEYKKYFDIVVSENESYNNLSKILIKK